jgi:superfamily II DNA or RNA helicase
MKLINKIEVQKEYTTYNLHIKTDHNYIVENAVVSNCHQTKANVIRLIMEKFVNAKYRLGFTGSLDAIQANIKTITGLFGPVNNIITSRELIERKEATPLLIKCLVLKYDEDTRKANKKLKYIDEVKYLISNHKRNVFIKNLALAQKQNTIVLSNYVEKHGRILFDLINNSKLKGDRNVYWIHGKVESEERERIRNILETETGSIIVATTSIMSTGISIRNLHSIILTTPGKSTIKIIQTCGRLLRLNDNKVQAVLFDLVDDMRIKNHNNFMIEHYVERVSVYNEQQFDYKLINVPFDQ